MLCYPESRAARPSAVKGCGGGIRVLSQTCGRLWFLMAILFDETILQLPGKQLQRTNLDDPGESIDWRECISLRKQCLDRRISSLDYHLLKRGIANITAFHTGKKSRDGSQIQMASQGQNGGHRRSLAIDPDLSNRDVSPSDVISGPFQGRDPLDLEIASKADRRSLTFDLDFI